MAKRYFIPDDWTITEERYQPELNGMLETVFALGNGYLGVRGTPEEGFHGGNSLPGAFIPLVYETGTMVYDWRRVGFPTKAQHVVVSPNWASITVTIDGVPFDPQTGTVIEYQRQLDMRDGTVQRRVVWEDGQGRRSEITSCRIVCLHAAHIGAIRYSVKPLNYSGEIRICAGIDGSPARECPIVEMAPIGGDGALLRVATVNTKIEVAMAMRTRLSSAGSAHLVTEEKLVGREYTISAQAGETYTLTKIVAACTSRDIEGENAAERAQKLAAKALREGFAALLDKHQQAWAKFWQEHDVVIENDPAGQQGIRFSLFNLNWNYAGSDPRINVGAKGLCDFGYGGLYFWDSEVYLLPYYTFNEPAKARNLLMQRFITLPQARDRAKLLRFEGALYPWTTLDGEDCGIPWECDMLEQHVSIAIPYGVWMYVLATGDEEFLRDYGAEMVLETSRFWASRVCFNERRGKYLINTITGPDEYAMVVNNNCYTNSMAKFVIEYGLEVIAKLQHEAPARWAELAAKIGFREEEAEKWRDITERMFIPFDRKLGIHPQDDSFLDMDPVDLATIPEEEKPLLAHWPWERIIRCQVLKQPDVLLLMFLRNDQYSAKVKRTNYEFYEPKTIHDSSLSPCIHSILAAELGLDAHAFDYYLRAARLDLDDVNGNAHAGVHIANLAGSWMSIVNGFAGLRLRHGRLCFDPHLPKAWERLAFTMTFRGRKLHVALTREVVTFTLQGRRLAVKVNGERVILNPGETSIDVRELEGSKV